MASGALHQDRHALTATNTGRGDAELLIVGTGLTMVDIVATLNRRETASETAP